MKTYRIAVTALVLALVATPCALSQGPLNPPGGPAPNMKSLSELADSLGALTPLKPSDLIELGAAVTAVGASNSLLQVNKAGANVGIFTVPAGKVLIITDMEIFPESHSTTALIAVQISQNSNARDFFRIRADRPFARHLRTGMVFASGASLTVGNASATGAPSFRFSAHGFLADDE